MIMQAPKKYGPTILGIIAVIFLFQNPAQAAGFVNKSFALMEQGANALGTFGNALNI